VRDSGEDIMNETDKQEFYLPPMDIKELYLRHYVANEIKCKIYNCLVGGDVLLAAKWFVFLRIFDYPSSDHALAMIRSINRSNKDVIDEFMFWANILDVKMVLEELREEFNEIMAKKREMLFFHFIYRGDIKMKYELVCDCVDTYILKVRRPENDNFAGRCVQINMYFYEPFADTKFIESIYVLPEVQQVGIVFDGGHLYMKDIFEVPNIDEIMDKMDAVKDIKTYYELRKYIYNIGKIIDSYVRGGKTK
jgi:hypothetical protein